MINDIFLHIVFVTKLTIDFKMFGKAIYLFFAQQWKVKNIY